MECFVAWFAFGFLYLHYLATRRERDHYRDGYWRVIDQWTESVMGKKDRS